MHYRLTSGWACIGFSTLFNTAPRGGGEQPGRDDLEAPYALFDSTISERAECQMLRGESLIHGRVIESKRVCYCLVGYMASEGVDAFRYRRV